MDPVSYNDSGKGNSPGVTVKRVYYTGSTALKRGGVVVYDKQADLGSFTKGPGIDVSLSSGASHEEFAGIVADQSAGNTGGWIDILVPKPGDVIWCRVASGLDNGDGVTIQASGTDQGFADGGAFAADDIGLCLMDEDASDNPYASDNLAPILFGLGIS